MAFFLGLVILAVIAWETFQMGWISYKALHVTLGAKQRRVTDATSLQSRPGPLAQKQVRELQAEGFVRLGETQTPLSPERKPITFVLVNPEKTVQAQVTSSGTMVEFSSIFREDVLVVTDYPHGAHITRPTYQSRTIPTSLEEAYQYHLQQLEAYRQRFGPEQRIQTIADHLKWESMGRVRYGDIKLRRHLWENILGTSLVLFVLLAILLLFYFYWPSRPVGPVMHQDLIRIRAEVVVIILSTGALFFHRAIVNHNLKQTRRDSRALTKR